MLRPASDAGSQSAPGICQSDAKTIGGVVLKAMETKDQSNF